MRWACSHVADTLLSEEEKLTWQAVHPTCLLERCDIGVLPVAHPRDADGARLRIVEGDQCVVILTEVKPVSYLGCGLGAEGRAVK